MDWKASHLCHFYKTKEELLREVALFVSHGLDAGEAGLWVVPESLFSIDTARQELTRWVTNLNGLERAGAMVFSTQREWYIPDGRFNLRRNYRNARAAERDARMLGFRGLRASADLSWIPEHLWPKVIHFEQRINHTLHYSRITALCTYDVTRCRPSMILELLNHHTKLVTEHPIVV